MNVKNILCEKMAYNMSESEILSEINKVITWFDNRPYTDKTEIDKNVEEWLHTNPNMNLWENDELALRLLEFGEEEACQYLRDTNALFRKEGFKIHFMFDASIEARNERRHCALSITWNPFYPIVDIYSLPH